MSVAHDLDDSARNFYRRGAGDVAAKLDLEGSGGLRDGPAEVGQIVRIAVMAVEAEGEDRQPDVAGVAHAMDDARAGQ